MDDSNNELERLANNATASISQATGYGPSWPDVQRWMELFGYSHLEAQYLLQRHRNDVIRNRTPDAHWELVRAEREVAGYNREAYEHVLQLSDLFLEQAVTVPGNPDGIPPKPGKVVQIIRVGGLLKDAQMVKEIGGLDDLPQVFGVVSEEGIPARLCKVSTVAKMRIKEWLDMQRILKPNATKTASAVPLRSQIRSPFEFSDEDLRRVDQMLPQRR